MNAKKIAAIVLAVVLVFGCGVGATLAWLMDTSNTVTNTFTVGDIDIVLKEHSLVNGQLSETEVEANIENTYKILPGTEQPKDPFVRFTKDSEACWLFVKIEEKYNAVSNKSYKYVTYTVDSTWKPLVDGDGDGFADDGVYYIDLTGAGVAADTEKNILANTKVSYDGNLTKEELTIADTNKPQLIFTAYAVQKEAATTAAEAWALVQSNPANP